jgi:hypothetical protein
MSEVSQNIYTVQYTYCMCLCAYCMCLLYVPTVCAYVPMCLCAYVPMYQTKNSIQQIIFICRIYQYKCVTTSTQFFHTDLARF